jgi:DNA-binding transcriptional LysR family regulator
MKVAQNNNLSDTAKLLGISQPSVKRRLQHLEIYFGQPLIRSKTNKIEITDFGFKIYSHFADKENEILDLLTTIAEPSTDISGTVSITMPMALSQKLILPKLHLFLESHPHLKLNLNFKVNEPNLLTSGYDMALSLTLPTQQSLVVKRVFSFNSILCCTSNYIHKYGLPAHPTELSNHNVISYIAPEGKKPEEIIFKHKISGKQIVVKNDTNIAVNSVMCGEAIMYSNEYILGAEEYYFADKIKSGQLIQVLPDYSFFTSDYYFIFTSRQKNARINAVCEFILKCVQDYIQLHQADNQSDNGFDLETWSQQN